jgi:transposase
MHLSYSSSTYKGKTYKSYTIAESYREGKKVKKRTIWPIGKLTNERAEQIRRICKVASGKEVTLSQLKDIVVKESRSYLDIALVNELWNYWQLDRAFDFDSSDSQLSTPLVAKILTINRCTAPCSHYSIPKWVAQNALTEVLKTNLSRLNDDKIYYELDKIYQNQTSIENHIFEQTHRKNAESYQYIDYDLTTSYFVGYKCRLSAFGKGKAECRGRRQVLLGVLINNEGYPFKWDVFAGNTAEVNTLEQNINACKERFKLSDSNVTLVFDRGIISDNNARSIEDAQMKYISALNRNQISGYGIDLKPFKTLSSTDGHPEPEGFKKYADDLYFYDHGVIDSQRLVVGFNPFRFHEDRRNRQEKIEFFQSWLRHENKLLETARRDRQRQTTENRILAELKRLKIKKYFDPPVLNPITVPRQLKNGIIKDVRSFRIEIKKNDPVIAIDKLLDGLCVFVTNHRERQGRGFKVKPQSIISAYRNKTKIEDVFKNVKSFLKIRPFFVNTERHVKAVYSICMLAYFLNKFLANQRKAAGEKDFLNSQELYAPFKDIDYVSLLDPKSGQAVTKSVELPQKTKNILKKLKMLHLHEGYRK